MKKQTLLEKAKSEKVMRRGMGNISPEEVDLAVAWLKGEIQTVQAVRAMYPGNSVHQGQNGLYKISNWLREAYRQGKIK